MYNLFNEKLKSCSKNICFSFSPCFIFCYYLVTPSKQCSLLIFVIEAHVNMNTIYKLFFMFLVGLFTKIDNLSKCVTLTKTPRKINKYFPIRQVISMRKFLHAFKTFPNFSFVCFHWKITWRLGKVNKIVNPLMHNVRKWSDTL